MLFLTFFWQQCNVNSNFLFLGLESYFLLLIFAVLGAMFGEFGEKRILAFFIYFELTQLLCVLLLLSWGLSFNSNMIELSTASLFIIGSSGAETGLALALFMRYFRLTGRTMFLAPQVIKQPWVSKTMFRYF